MFIRGFSQLLSKLLGKSKNLSLDSPTRYIFLLAITLGFDGSISGRKVVYREKKKAHVIVKPFLANSLRSQNVKTIRTKSSI